MVKKDKAQDSIFTNQIRNLLKRLYVESQIKDSLLDQARDYFTSQETVESIIEEFERKQVSINADIAQGNATAKQQKLLSQLEIERTLEEERQQAEREKRNTIVQNLCEEILELCEGATFEETNRKSAQLLGTIQLLSPMDGSKRIETHEQHKALYKAVLSLRLLDRLILDKKIDDAYVSKVLGDITPEQFQDLSSHCPETYQRYMRDIKFSVIIVALIQDIGNYHPEARAILEGENGDLSPFRMLEVEERKELLQINYRESVKFLTEGIGVTRYMGNSKKERDAFVENEKQKMVFMKRLLRKAVNPQNSIGNILKVPQIYTSIVLSTKENFSYKLIPKVFQALNQNAERGNCSQMVVDSLYQITGMFPQGFGITHIPLDAHGNSLERYEYAIVNDLYPTDPEEPNCRIATRQLCFIGYGSDLVVKKTENTYFKESAERLAKISRERLLEILEKLVSNYTERSELDLIPRCWHAKDFFSIKVNQKLWNRSQHDDDE